MLRGIFWGKDRYNMVFVDYRQSSADGKTVNLSVAQPSHLFLTPHSLIPPQLPVINYKTKSYTTCYYAHFINAFLQCHSSRVTMRHNTSLLQLKQYTFNNIEIKSPRKEIYPHEKKHLSLFGFDSHLHHHHRFIVCTSYTT